MNIRSLVFAALVSGVAAFAGDEIPTSMGPILGFGFGDGSDAAFQVRFASNLALGDSVINLTNAGGSSTLSGLTAASAPTFAQNGDICANIYAYSPDEQLVSCCSCNVTPNGLNSLSVKNDLASNTLTPIIPSALVIKLLATEGGAKCTANKAATVTSHELEVGLLAWGTTIHALPTSPVSYDVVETKFSAPVLTKAELARMTQLCAFIRANGSGYGICKSCKVGGLGAASK